MILLYGYAAKIIKFSSVRLKNRLLNIDFLVKLFYDWKARSLQYFLQF